MDDVYEKQTLEATVVDLAQRLTAARIRIAVLGAKVDDLKKDGYLVEAANQRADICGKRTDKAEARVAELEKELAEARKPNRDRYVADGTWVLDLVKRRKFGFMNASTAERVARDGNAGTDGMGYIWRDIEDAK